MEFEPQFDEEYLLLLLQDEANTIYETDPDEYHKERVKRGLT